MPGGTLQLFNYQNNPIDFTMKNPDITFFKSVHKKYTNFSIDCIDVNFNQEPDLSTVNNNHYICRLDKLGHLLKDTYLVIELPSIVNSIVIDGVTVGTDVRLIDDFAINIIDSVSVQIGGDIIHEFDSDWINIYYRRYLTYEKYREVIGMINPAKSHVSDLAITNQTLYIWLPFFFSKDPSLGLPLYSLEYHTIYINVHLKPLSKWMTYVNLDNIRVPVEDPRMLVYNDERFRFFMRVNSVFFDESERNKIQMTRQEHLIQQIHTITSNQINEKKIRIDNYLKRPLKEFFIIGYREDNKDRNTFGNYTNFENNINYSGGLNQPPSGVFSDYHTQNYIDQIYEQKALEFRPEIIDQIQLYLDDKPRFHVLKSNYLRLVQDYQYDLNFQEMDNYIYHYSFSSDPKEVQPSGSLNLGRVHTSYFDLTLTMTPPTQPIIENLATIRNILKNKTDMSKNTSIINDSSAYAWKYGIKIYLVTYNILKIFGGMADLMFKK
jgi:hypothetical protein